MWAVLAAAPALVPSWDGLCASRHQDFLTEYWQKRPLLIRGLLSPEEVEALCPLTPDELVDLAGDADVCSRLVLETGGAQPWELRHGPFEPDVLELMGSGPACSLLVQQVDQLVPEVGRLRERFDFVPRWRTDDVMVSFAPPGGSVGAHLDNYDVFLLQGAGERRWSIEGTPRAAGDEALREGPQVRVLEEFAPTDEWLLRPGDALYLPPRYAHHGVSEHAECVTYSNPQPDHSPLTTQPSP